MNNIEIKKLNDDDEIPYKLLLLADPSNETIDKYIHSGECYAAYDQAEIIGVYVIIMTEPYVFELVNVAVSEEYQRKGIGRKLIFHAIEIVKGKKAKFLEVGTGNSSIYQLALYQKCGFRIIGVDRNFFKIHYKQQIIENGIECIDMIRLRMDL